MSTETLSGLIIDALIDAGIVAREDAGNAVAIATTEIEVRLALGDVIVPAADPR